MFRNNKGIRYGLNLVSECKEAEDKSGKAARRTVLILVDAIYRIQAQSAIVAMHQLLCSCFWEVQAKSESKLGTLEREGDAYLTSTGCGIARITW